MTNQEASKIIKDGIEDMSLDFADEEQYEALNMAIKALEQEPSGDLISRKKVLNQIFYSTDNSGDVVLDSTLRRRIENLPPVKQEPKTGHWIKHDNGAWWECSKCHAERAYGNEYCPDCGSHNGDIARMVEPQESEEV